MQIICKIKTYSNKKLLEFNRTEFQEKLNKVKDGDYVLLITKQENIRTLNQNAYFWGVVMKCSADAMGLDKHTANMQLKDVLGFWKLDKSGKYALFESTSDMSIKRLAEYIDQIKKLMFNQFGLIIPEPNESINDL